MNRKIFIGLMTAFFLLTAFSFAPNEIAAQSRKAKNLVKEGDQFFVQKDYQSAVNKYAEAIRASPKYPQAYYNKGAAHYYLKQYDEAAQDLSTALAQGYNATEIYKVRAYVYLDSRNYDAAFGDVQQLIKLQPSNVNYVLLLGDIYINKKDCENALATYRRASQLDARNGDIDYWMAYCYNELNDSPSRGTAAKSALDKGTRYVGESYYFYGLSQLAERNSLGAMEAFERAINAKPDIYAPYVFLGDMYRGQGRFNDAINVTLKGLENFPEDGSMYINLTWFYSLADKHDLAVEAGLKAVQFKPDDSLSYTNLCRAYNDVRQYSQAIDACKKALQIAPNDGETNFYIGRSYSFLNQKEAADRYYRSAVAGLEEYTDKNPENSDGFYLLGNAYAVTGQADKAIQAYLRCIELSPRYAKARVNLGYLYFTKGNTAAANAQYEELKKFDAVNAEKLRQAMNQK